MLSEDVLARLKSAEAEAAELRRQLASIQQAGGQAGQSDAVEDKPKRIDGTDSRETLFAAGKRSSWLSEADVEFFTGNGRVETGEEVTEEQQSAVQRRLLVGGLATAGLLAFGLVPTKDLQLKPSKPLFFYLVPLLGVQEQLGQCGTFIADGDWASLRLVLPRIQGAPGSARDNMLAAIALLPDTRTATKAEEVNVMVVGDFVDYLDAMDYNKYFDTMPRTAISGAQNAEFVRFSGDACAAAQKRLAAFLALMPADQVAAARQQLEAGMPTT